MKKSGIVVMQYPEGVKLGDETAYIIVGIAGKDNDHLAILANIATTLDECSDAKLQEFYNTKDVNLLYDIFTKSE